MPANINIEKAVSNYSKKMAAAKWDYLKELSRIEKEENVSNEDLCFALKSLNPAHITTKRSTQIGNCLIGASFRVLLSNYILEKSFYKNKKLVAPGANDKLIDGLFLSLQGYPVPQILDNDADPESVLNYDNCIIKSKIGAASKGVFIKNKQNFYHFFDRKNYSYKDFLIFSELNKYKRFIVEEYLGMNDSVTDLKFYMFYGEPGIVLEVERSKDGNKHCFYNSKSEVVETGRYLKTSYNGNGFDQDILKTAMEISALVPSPFIRVDFIVNKSSYKVGELTAHPGGFEEFNKEWDSYLGEKFVKAKARLFNDLLEGKDFSKYLNRYDISLHK